MNRLNPNSIFYASGAGFIVGAAATAIMYYGSHASEFLNKFKGKESDEPEKTDEEQEKHQEQPVEVTQQEIPYEDARPASEQPV